MARRSSRKVEGKKAAGFGYCGWDCKCDYKKMLLAGIAGGIVLFLVHTVSAILSMGYYTDPAYLGVWSGLMMPTAGAPPLAFTILSLATAFITVCIFAWAYEMIRGCLPSTGWKKGASFGVFLFMLVSMTSFLMQTLLFNLPSGLQVWWAVVDGLIGMVLVGIVIWKIYDG